MHENEILSLISVKIGHLVLDLLQGYIGLCNAKVKIFDLNTSCTTLVAEDSSCCDRFKVTIPYAGHTITWEVLFDHYNPEAPPDFIFGSDDFDFCPDLNSLQLVDPSTFLVRCDD